MYLKVEQCILPLIEKYEDDKKLFRFYKKYTNPDTFNTTLNGSLKAIGRR
ncbi:hypothetical protein [Elizabethkingia argenteiflava]|nr:hypothetical protein [Elizabethkingia argenteiflava]